MASVGSTFFRLVFQLVGGLGMRRCMRRIDELVAKYASLDDAAVRNSCRELIESPKIFNQENSSRSWGIRFEPRKLGDLDAEALAVGREAFIRFPPAGIERGAQPFPEQMLAAAHLVRGSLVQMDTGEGKTYAFMIAAFALLRLHEKVYIITANPYLAMRDTVGTAPFWSALGVSVGVVLPEQYATDTWPSWDAQVVYTTAHTLIFDRMSDDLVFAPENRLLHRAALLVDEVDAVLLDQISGSFTTSRKIARKAKDWHLACALAGLLTEEHVELDSSDESLRVHLTEAGQEEVIRLSGSMLEDFRHLTLYKDVELAYAGLYVATEGRDYEIVSGTIVPIDSKSGWRTLTSIPDWVAPLASHKHVRQSSWVQYIHITDGLDVLLGFDHFAGASGTVIDEALEYLLVGGLPTAVVRPRKPRYSGTKPDLTFTSIEEVENYVREVVERESARRPVLVVTSSSIDAYKLAKSLEKVVSKDISVRYAYGETFAEQQLFEQAGEAGTVIVSTRQAGRGVDIQLSEAARRNGGTLLLLIGHSAQARLDRQLLGRVGRGGDPYEAYFCNHPNDGLLNQVTDLRAYKRMNIEGPIKSRNIQRIISSLQKNSRAFGIQEFARQVSYRRADSEAFNVIRRWYCLVQQNFESRNLAAPFFDELVQMYLSYHVPGVEGRSISDSQAQVAAAKVMLICGRPKEAQALAQRLTGQDSKTAKEILARAMLSALSSAMQENSNSRGRAHADLQFARQAEECFLLLRHFERRVALLEQRAAQLPPAGETDEIERQTGNHMERQISAGLSDGESIVALKFQTPLIREWISQAQNVPEALLPAPVEIDALSFDGDINSLAVLTAAMLAVERDSAGISPDFLASIKSAINRAMATIAVMVARLPSLEKLRDLEYRAPAQIAHETIASVSDIVYSRHQRIWFDLARRQLSGARYQSAYIAGAEDLRKMAEATLADQMCSNLVAGANPSSLDELFSAVENQVYTPLEPSLIVALASQFAAPPLTNQPLAVKRQTSDQLIADFVDTLMKARHKSLLRNPPTREEILPALNVVLDGSSFAVLSTPDGVVEALDRWRRHPVRRRMLPWRRHRTDRVVQEFLGYLHAKGLSARLPKGIGERTHAMRRRMTAWLTTPRTALGVLLTLPAVALCVGLLIISVGTPLFLTGALRLLDLCLGLGQVSAEKAVAPVLVALSGAAIFGWLVRGFSRTVEPHPAGDRFVAIILLILTSCEMTVAAGDSWLHAVPLILVLCFAGFLSVHLIWTAEAITQISLTACLTGAGILFIALPALVRGGHDGSLLLAAAVGASLSVVWRFFPVRLPVYSQTWADVPAERPEDVSGTHTIAVNVDWRVHLFALIVSLPLASIGRSAQWITPCLYGVVYVIWIRGIATSVTDPSRWAVRLRGIDQIYAGTERYPHLRDRLSLVRRQLFVREAAIGACYITIVSILAPAGSLLGGQKISIGLLVGCLGLIGVELLATGILSFRSLTGVESPSADIDSSDVLAEGSLADARELLNRMARRFGVVVIIYLALAKLAEILDVWKLVHDIFHFLGGLF